MLMCRARGAAAGSFSRVALAALILAQSAVLGATAAADTLPGFQETTYLPGLDLPTSFVFDDSGRIYVAEKKGVIKLFQDLDDANPIVLIDLNARVYNYWDRGLLAIALHPNYPTQPYLYALYTHDGNFQDDPSNPAWSPKWGTPGITTDPCPEFGSPAIGERCVASGRVSRLEIVNDAVVSEVVLVQDWFQQFPGHSVGDLAFGVDGYLYVSAGDGANPGPADWGQFLSHPGTVYPDDPLYEGGALRAQDVRTSGDALGLSGSVIRIDPLTGAGAPDNPLSMSPDANARRIVAYGLRNPYRMVIPPQTNQVWIGDVGTSRYEELNIISDPTSDLPNFGWPCYEGNGTSLPTQTNYDSANVPLCESLYMTPADETTTPVFQYFHSALVAGPTDPCGTGPDIDASITGLTFYAGGTYPPEYTDALFVADYTRRCIWTMFPEPGGTIDFGAPAVFAFNAANPVDMDIGPDGDIFYLDLGASAMSGVGSLRRIRAVSNEVPVACFTATPTNGPSPLQVDFDASCASDAEGPVTFEWDLDGDGMFNDGSGIIASFTYLVGGTYTARLRVTDTMGASDLETVTITSGNTAPVCVIDSPAPSYLWSANQAISLSGSVTDGEDGVLSPATFNWTFAIQHGGHVHPPFAAYAGVAAPTIVAPEHEYPSKLIVRFNATDSGGLSDMIERIYEPRTVTATLLSDPPGLTLGLDNLLETTPFTETVITGSHHWVTAQSLLTRAEDGLAYRFVEWSDLGADSHGFVAGTANTTLLARYELIAPDSPDAGVASPPDAGVDVSFDARVDAPDAGVMSTQPGGCCTVTGHSGDPWSTLLGAGLFGLWLTSRRRRAWMRPTPRLRP